MTRDPRKARIQAALRGRDPVWGRTPALILHGAIVAAAVILTLDSEPVLPDSLRGMLHVAEAVLLAVFTAEYVLRLWSAPSRWRYALSFWGLIDLGAILPALLLLAPEMQTLRVLRLLRALRLVKLLRLSRAAERLARAVHRSRHDLALFSILSALVLFLAAVGIHYFEAEAQPEDFGSITLSLWWALATITTVGYGDVYPVTAGGRIFTGLALLVGLAIVAIPTAVITMALLTGAETDDDREK